MINFPETPCVVVDYDILMKNIQQMQSLCDESGCNLRPHIKTHKSVEIAKMQIAAGAAGITCAKLSEAEVMAEGGIDDIFVAIPLIGSKILRGIELAGKIKRLILTVDSIEGATALSKEAQRNNIKLEVRLEIDTGARRTGLPIQAGLDLADKISNLPGLNLTGVWTFKGMTYNGKKTTNHKEAVDEEGALLYDFAQTLIQRGLNIKDISGGSTPTSKYYSPSVAKGHITEIRPGTYVFNDVMCMLYRSCTEEDISASIYATVISTPTSDLAIIDGGSKTFATDQKLNTPPHNFHSFAYVKGRPDLRFDRLSEELGMLRTESGCAINLKVGDILELFPTHICPTINLHNKLYVKEGGIFREIPVNARGMVF